MSDYLYRYKEQYRLRVPYDESTCDWMRDLVSVDANGKKKNCLETLDVYIQCTKNDQIYDVDTRHSLLQAYISSATRGKKILKQIINDYVSEYNINLQKIEEKIEKDMEDYKNLPADERLSRWKPTKDDLLYKYISESNFIITNIQVTDAEVLFDFRAKHLESIAEYVKPLAPYKKKSPFLKKYLPKSEVEKNNRVYNPYKLPEGAWDEVFRMSSILAKSNGMKASDYFSKLYCDFEDACGEDIIEAADEANYKPIHYIHKLGLFDKFMEWLKVEAENARSEEELEKEEE